MRRTVISVISLAAIVCVASMPAPTRKGVQATRLLSRTFEFIYVVHVPALSPSSHEMRIWLPLPQTEAHQEISAVDISSPLAYRVYTDKMHGNRAVYFSFHTAKVRTPFAITLKFRARRNEYRVPLPSNDPAPSSSQFSPNIARYLEPDRLVPINGMIADLVLSPRQSGSAINYFVYPYAELDGKPFANLGHQFSFHDVSIE